MIGTLLTVLGAGAVAGGATYTVTKGVKVEEGQLGQPGIGPKWRIRFAGWRWRSEVWTARNGWRFIGDYKTPELAKGAALAAAQDFMTPALTVRATRTSYARTDV